MPTTKQQSEWLFFVPPRNSFTVSYCFAAFKSRSTDYYSAFEEVSWKKIIKWKRIRVVAVFSSSSNVHSENGAYRAKECGAKQQPNDWNSVSLILSVIYRVGTTPHRAKSDQPNHSLQEETLKLFGRNCLNLLGVFERKFDLKALNFKIPRALFEILLSALWIFDGTSPEISRAKMYGIIAEIIENVHLNLLSVREANVATSVLCNFLYGSQFTNKFMSYFL